MASRTKQKSRPKKKSKGGFKHSPKVRAQWRARYEARKKSGYYSGGKKKSRGGKKSRKKAKKSYSRARATRTAAPASGRSVQISFRGQGGRSLGSCDCTCGR